MSLPSPQHRPQNGRNGVYNSPQNSIDSFISNARAQQPPQQQQRTPSEPVWSSAVYTYASNPQKQLQQQDDDVRLDGSIIRNGSRNGVPTNNNNNNNKAGANSSLRAPSARSGSAALDASNRSITVLSVNREHMLGPSRETTAVTHEALPAVTGEGSINHMTPQSADSRQLPPSLGSSQQRLVLPPTGSQGRWTGDKDSGPAVPPNVGLLQRQSTTVAAQGPNNMMQALLQQYARSQSHAVGPVLHVPPSMTGGSEAGVMQISTTTLTKTTNAVRYIEMHEDFDPRTLDTDGENSLTALEEAALVNPTRYAQLLRGAVARDPTILLADAAPASELDNGVEYIMNTGQRWVRRANRPLVATTRDPAGSGALYLPAPPQNPQMVSANGERRGSTAAEEYDPFPALERAEGDEERDEEDIAEGPGPAFLVQRHVQQTVTGRRLLGNTAYANPTDTPRRSSRATSAVAHADRLYFDALRRDSQQKLIEGGEDAAMPPPPPLPTQKISNSFLPRQPSLTSPQHPQPKARNGSQPVTPSAQHVPRPIQAPIVPAPVNPQPQVPPKQQPTSAPSQPNSSVTDSVDRLPSPSKESMNGPPTTHRFSQYNNYTFPVSAERASSQRSAVPPAVPSSSSPPRVVVPFSQKDLHQPTALESVRERIPTPYEDVAEPPQQQQQQQEAPVEETASNDNEEGGDAPLRDDGNEPRVTAIDESERSCSPTQSCEEDTGRDAEAEEDAAMHTPEQPIPVTAISASSPLTETERRMQQELDDQRLAEELSRHFEKESGEAEEGPGPGSDDHADAGLAPQDSDNMWVEMGENDDEHANAQESESERRARQEEEDARLAEELARQFEQEEEEERAKAAGGTTGEQEPQAADAQWVESGETASPTRRRLTTEFGGRSSSTEPEDSTVTREHVPPSTVPPPPAEAQYSSPEDVPIGDRPSHHYSADSTQPVSVSEYSAFTDDLAVKERPTQLIIDGEVIELPPHPSDGEEGEDGPNTAPTDALDVDQHGSQGAIPLATAASTPSFAAPEEVDGAPMGRYPAEEDVPNSTSLEMAYQGANAASAEL